MPMIAAMVVTGLWRAFVGNGGLKRVYIFYVVDDVTFRDRARRLSRVHKGLSPEYIRE